MPSFPKLDAPLVGDGVELRLEAERDIPEVLIAHQQDPELFVRLGLERPPSGAELGRRIEEAGARGQDGSGVRFTIVVPGDDTLRGQIDVHRVDWDNLRAEAGIWVLPGERGHGLASRSLPVLACWLFERCRLERLELLTEPENTRMISAARRAGFIEEGVLRAYVRERGHRVDVAVLSVLPSDLESS
jgi:RimJ/RimL family protein N-acetyltransferase